LIYTNIRQIIETAK